MKTWPANKLGEIFKQIAEGLTRAFAMRKSTASNKTPPSKIITHTDQLIEQKEQESATEPLIQEVVKTEEQGASFLICPIQGNDSSGAPLTPYTVKISAVLDHSDTAIDPDSNRHWGKNAKDQKVKAFNGEIGEGAQCPQEPCGYPQKGGGEFFQNKEINYVGVSYDGGKNTLQYDGHAGYDFSYPKFTPVVAPADGKLYKAAQGKDTIYGASWDKDHSFYIEHKNGFITWFRHCEKFADRIENEISNDHNRHCEVVSDEIIAHTGRFENWKLDGTSPHLHFEVRDKGGKIVDPYKDKLWK